MEWVFGKIKSLDNNSDQLLFVNNCGHFKDISIPIKTNRPNGRKDFQIIFFYKGYCYMHINGVKQKISEGDVVIFYPDQPQIYEFDNNSNCSYVWAHFGGENAKSFLNSLNINQSLYKISDIYSFIPLFNEMIAECKASHFASEQKMMSILIEILIKFARHIYTPEKVNRLILKVILMMNDKGSFKLSNADFAKVCNMSEYHFIRSFKQYTGKTPLQYKTEIIIIEAKEMLAMTELSVNYIADSVGISDPLYFSRIFKKHTGYSPTEYRLRFWD